VAARRPLQGGGQETTLLTAVTQLVHHGMVFVPTGYTYGGEWAVCCGCCAACHLIQGLHLIAIVATRSQASLA
jgi:multimeric flavodoxin WrbA